MENQKDINEKMLPSQAESITDRSNNLYSTSLSQMSVIVKKTDKLVTALYMVTDFFETTEPMKIRLRTLCINLLSSVRVFDSAAATGQDVSFHEIISQTEEIMAMIEIASIVGIMSEMNASILNKEFHSLRGLVEKNFELSARSFFAQKPASKFTLGSEIFYSDHQTPSFPFSQTRPFEGASKKDIPDQVYDVKKPSIQNSNSQGQHGIKNKKADHDSKINRRNEIIAFIKDKGEVNIKDIPYLVNGYSEKTLQRLLGSLVSEGVLKRTGDKRWSRYSIS